MEILLSTTSGYVLNKYISKLKKKERKKNKHTAFNSRESAGKLLVKTMTWFSHFTTHQTFHFFWKLKCSFLICTLNVLKLSTWIEKVKQRGGTWESVWVSVDGHLQTPDPCLTPKIWPICKYGSYLHIYIFTYIIQNCWIVKSASQNFCETDSPAFIILSVLSQTGIWQKAASQRGLSVPSVYQTHS